MDVTDIFSKARSSAIFSQTMKEIKANIAHFLDHAKTIGVIDRFVAEDKNHRECKFSIFGVDHGMRYPSPFNGDVFFTLKHDFEQGFHLCMTAAINNQLRRDMGLNGEGARVTFQTIDDPQMRDFFGKFATYLVLWGAEMRERGNERRVEKRLPLLSYSYGDPEHVEPLQSPRIVNLFEIKKP